jgi:predicted transcriptional regulator
MYEFYVRQKIETGLKAVNEGRTISHAEAKKRLLGDAD